MSNIFKKHTATLKDTKSRYEIFGLKENPFPANPFVNKVSVDERYNGMIYEGKIRENELNQVYDNFLREPQSNPHHIRLGYIMDNSYVGRGNGKSAFTLDLIKRINSDFCLDISGEVNKCFGLHISPQPSGRTKTFNDFADLVFEEIINRNIIEYSLASLRFEALSELENEYVKIAEDEFKVGQNIVEKLNSSKFFADHKISVNKVAAQIYSKSEFGKIGQGFPLGQDKNKFYNHNVVTVKDFAKHYQDLKKGKERLQFIFNDLVLFFEAAGFNGAYIIIDDFERIPDFQSEKLKHEFALEIRTNFFDGISENARVGFYNLILVLHAGVPRLIEKAWAVSGMDRRSPILSEAGPFSKHIISFNKLNIDHAKSLVEIYLDKYRNDGKVNSLEPFDIDSIALISEKSDYNASAILQKAYVLLEQAADKGLKNIDVNLVNEVIGEKNDIDDYQPDDISNEESDDLFSKAKNK